MALLTLRNVSLSFGGPKILDGVDWQIERGDRISLLGRNGEGKSTLLKLLDEQMQPDDGEVIRQQGLRVARLMQEVPDGRTGTVAQEVAAGLPDAHEHHHDGHALADHRVDTLLSRMGLDPDAPFASLSSGMKRRVLLARALASEPDVLLLDEPTNHLDIESIRWLEDFLLRFPGTLIFVTHDRALLAKLATRIAELDRGHLYDWTCDYPTFLKRKEDALAAEEKQRALFDKRLAQEEVWIRKGIEARRTRNEGRVRALMAMRVDRQKRRERQGTAKIVAQEAERSGALVVATEDVSGGYGDRTVISGLTTTIMRGDKVGIIGPNGAGKSTLLRLLLGQLAPTSGTIKTGTNLEIAYFDQLKEGLDDDKTVQMNVTINESVVINGRSRHILGYLQDFLFAPERSRTLVKYLSGGERSRLLLAKLFTRPSNVLVLDEPTNDLDIETLELLESLIVDYSGTVLLVSHDRAFLNDVVGSTLAIEPTGEVKEYDGGYDDYLRQRSSSSSPPSETSKTPSRSLALSPAPRPKKLGNKERRELEALPLRIEALETSRHDLSMAMADPAFFKRDPSSIASDHAKLAEIEQELATCFARWEELEAMGG